MNDSSAKASAVPETPPEHIKAYEAFGSLDVPKKHQTSALGFLPFSQDAPTPIRIDHDDDPGTIWLHNLVQIESGVLANGWYLYCEERPTGHVLIVYDARTDPARATVRNAAPPHVRS